MKNFLIKNWFVITLFILCVIEGFMLNHQSILKQSLNDYRKVMFDSGAMSANRVWQDGAKRQHVTVSDLVLNQQLVITLAAKDSLLQICKIKDKQIQGFTQMISHLHITGKLDTFYKHDTVTDWKDNTHIAGGQINFSWNDRWDTLEGSVGDENIFHLNIIDSSWKVDFWKRDKWLGLKVGTKRYYSDFYHINKNITQTGATSISIRKNPNRWVLSVSGGYGYHLDNLQVLKPSVIIGITLGRKVIEF